MSNPFIQVELDALKRAPLLASVLGIQGSEAVDPWMGLAHIVEAVRAEAAALARPE